MLPTIPTNVACLSAGRSKNLESNEPPDPVKNTLIVLVDSFTALYPT